ncbi:YitT family protein [Rathayibacter oskolensis]|uniref:YitT family protein n=1 Tax=Rathayibacter TaxID=33886 RepID=UPI001318BF6B|nr:MULTISPECIES: YitT family protein [Rathayibacter]QHC67686.1 YitT family protein [Rathayibacter sp. VKM Ac-2759]WKK72167.1 YitT family protein [Rathayibacter oskolensis]
MSDPTATVPHSRVEDVFGLVTGAFVVSFGLFLLRASEAVTGGTAGLALLLGYALPIPFGVILVTVNLPFLALSLWKKGWRFTLRTMFSIALVSVLAGLHPLAFGSLRIDPVYGVLTGDVLAGIGLLILFRHGSSLGGFSIVALIAQERLGWRAGYVMMALDACVVVAALLVVPPVNVLISAAGVVVLNLVLAFNHRPGRYLGS